MDTTENVLPDVVEKVSAGISHFVFYLYVLTLFLMPALGDLGNSFLGMALWLIIPPFVCFMIYIAVRKNSRFTAFHARQAMVFDLIIAGGVLAMSMLFSKSVEGSTSVGSVLGLCLLPLIWLPFVPFFAGIRALRGREFHYPVIGKYLMDRPGS